VFTYIHNHTDYSDFFHGFAEALGVRSHHNKIELPEAVGTGYMKLLVLPEGLQAMVSNFKLNDDGMMHRKKSTEEFYNLRFEEIIIPGTLVLENEGEKLKESNLVHAGAVLFSSLFDNAYTLSKGSRLRSINILMSTSWMKSHLGLDSNDEILQQYLSFKTAGFNFEPFDAEYRSFFNEVMEDHTGNPLHKAVIQNRIMLLIEKFFKNLSVKTQKIAAAHKINLSHKEIDKLMEVESLLINDFSTPAPTIAQLAKTAAMSPSKLKSSFRQVYGSGLYEYYQKVRMQKARTLLLSRKYSVKEVGTQLGYTNLSNFALAFKKQFNTLPSKM
jgi:AraC-like DNA-binding protein